MSFGRSGLARAVRSGACVVALAFAEQASADPARLDEHAAAPAPEALELCVAQHERGRTYKTEVRLFEAREALQRCAARDCPLAIRADCENWLVEVEALVPTALVVLEGSRTGSPRVLVDGEPWSGNLEAPLELAPGRHRLRFESPPHPPIEIELELSPGEKNRIVRVRFEAEAPKPVEPARPELVKIVPNPTPAWSRPVPAATYWLGAGALACASAAAILAGSALVDESRARDQCAPRCPSSVRKSIEQRVLFADITGAAALGLAGAALYTYLARPAVSTHAAVPRVEVQAAPGRAELLLRGRF